MNARWAIDIPFLPDELLSSWLVRAALTQGCDPLVLTGTLWPQWRIWTMDPDRGLSGDRIQVLANMSGIGASHFQSASIRAIATEISQQPLDSLATWPWMLAQGARNRARRGGLQYCPVCLQEDKTPYYRRRWRLAWHTECQKHGVLLLDRCSECHSPLAPNRLSAMDRHLATCATCRRDLRNVNTVPLSPGSLNFQQAADSVLMDGNATYGETHLSTADWFELSRYFLMVLRKVARNPNGKLASFVTELGTTVDRLLPSETGLALELLPVGERALFLAGTMEMLQAGPTRFLTAAKDSSLTRASLLEQRSKAPDVIATLTHDLSNSRVSRVRGTPTTMNKPRSRQTVRRMFARLQRKILASP